jgi:membrane protease YdiL (CAAX protease family)
MVRARNYIEVLAFVVVWMAAGWIFHLDANAYLLLGVPLVALFQLFIRRQPLQKLWARDATSFRLGLVGVGLGALLMLAPAYDLMVVALPNRLWVAALWLLCALAGALFAAFGVLQQRASAARRGLPSFVAAVLIGVAIMAASAYARNHLIWFPLPKLLFLLKQFLLYFAVSFALEEVAFRGALDSHVYQTQSNGRASGSSWLSAIFVSGLWGVWHLPNLPIPNASTFAAAIPALIIVHTLVGVPLSFCWRASGTLVLPAAAHALIDAYRNTVM